MGIKILLPHVNESDVDFTVKGNAIRFGLTDIKYISDGIANKIVASAPFKNYAHLLETSKSKGSGINSRAIQALNAIGAAAFDDNKMTGKESENLYEYLNVPKFDIRGIVPYIKAQINSIEDFEEQGCFILMAMVKSIKKGQGWSRVELVDDTGTAGIFHTENTQIESGNMYIFLVGDNRIHQYVTINDVIDKKDNSFINYLYTQDYSNLNEKKLIVDFTNYKTKQGKMMAHVIYANDDKSLQRVLVFSKNYTLALGKAKPGTACILDISTLDDGTRFVKDIK